MPDDRNCQVIEALEARPLRGRRAWSAEAKARLVEETLQPGANVSAIARRAGVASSQLFGWRRKAIRSGVVRAREPAERLGFVEVGTVATSLVEISLGDAVIRVSGEVDAAHLIKVIRAVRQA